MPSAPSGKRYKLCCDRKCSKRGEPQPYSAFHVRSRNPDGTVKEVRSRCKPCYLRYDREAKNRRDARGTSGDNPLLPAGPFADWLRRELVLAGDVKQLAWELGMHEKHLRLVLGGQERVMLSVVDMALVGAGVPGVLNELYPIT